MPETSDLLFSTHQLCLGYEDTTIVRNLSFSVPKGALVGIVGPNGSGKTTLLETLATKAVPQDGLIQGLSTCSVAYLPQRCSMDRSFPLTVRDLVGSGLWTNLGLFAPFLKKHKQTTLDALQQTGISSFSHALLSSLSGGQFQRALFSRIIAQNAQLLLLDEPLTGLDEPTAESLLKIIKKWNKDGKTILATLHDAKLVKSLCSHTLLLARDFSRWGPTEKVMTPSNLERAYDASHEWGECAC